MNRDSGSSAVEVTLRSWVEPTARMRGSEAGGLTAAEQDLKGIRAPDAAGLRHLLSAFGGMGSLADLTSDRRNATVVGLGNGFANNQLSQLRTFVFELAQALQDAG